MENLAVVLCVFLSSEVLLSFKWVFNVSVFLERTRVLSVQETSSFATDTGASANSAFGISSVRLHLRVVVIIADSVASEFAKSVVHSPLYACSSGTKRFAMSYTATNFRSSSDSWVISTSHLVLVWLNVGVTDSIGLKLAKSVVWFATGVHNHVLGSSNLVSFLTCL